MTAMRDAIDHYLAIHPDVTDGTALERICALYLVGTTVPDVLVVQFGDRLVRYTPEAAVPVALPDRPPPGPIGHPGDGGMVNLRTDDGAERADLVTPDVELIDAAKPDEGTGDEEGWVGNAECIDCGQVTDALPEKCDNCGGQGFIHPGEDDQPPAAVATGNPF